MVCEELRLGREGSRSVMVWFLEMRFEGFPGLTWLYALFRAWEGGEADRVNDVCWGDELMER
jgi:hypothetical protein